MLELKTIRQSNSQTLKKEKKYRKPCTTIFFYHKVKSNNYVKLNYVCSVMATKTVITLKKANKNRGS